ncbi:MAG: phosphoglucosamine mutase [Pirellulales bacterium]|nr:phosphoglucosamine mutase [Pirellulales bacterium]
MTPAEPIISVSGLRGIVGNSLTPDLAIRYVAAFCASIPAGPIVVTRDGRQTGQMLREAIRAAIVASGRNCLDADIAATPTTGILIRHLAAAGGIQITASHNPAAYNGIKLFSDKGRVIPADAGERVLEAYHQAAFTWASHEQMGRVESVTDTVSEHLRLVTASIDLPSIKNRRFRVLLDSNHGAGSVVGGPLLDALGCQATLLDKNPDGRFAHPPEPIAEHLLSVAEQARGTNADVTFCQDPDADRLAIIDENGRYIGEECTLALCVEHILSRRSSNPEWEREKVAGKNQEAVVTNCSTSRMTEDIAKKFNAAFYQSAVGEANVVDQMQKHAAIIGGEGNGGVIDPQVGWVRDSFVGMAWILDMMATTNQPISQLADALPQYAIHKSKVALRRDAIERALAAVEHNFHDGTTSSRLDGLRINWNEGPWLLVRPSNTEPIVRVIAEAKTADHAERICCQAVEVLRRFG